MDGSSGKHSGGVRHKRDGYGRGWLQVDAEFQNLLRQALRIDLKTSPEDMQLNLAVQRRARWLLSRIDKLFPEPK